MAEDDSAAPAAVPAPGGAPLTKSSLEPWAPLSDTGASKPPPSPAVLLGMVLVIATAGLVYELSMAAVASYLLGDSVRQFSLIIGAYLSALGLGAYLSRFVGTRLAAAFADVELATAVVGGLSAPAIFLGFAYTRAFEPLLFAVVIAVGVLVGVELPLLLRILERRVEFKELIARALTVDYAGALVGSLAFTFVLVPELGLLRSSIACGVVNAVTGYVAARVLSGTDAAEARALSRAQGRAVVVVLFLLATFAAADRITELGEAAIYPGPVVLSRTSPYQRIVVTEHDGAFDLFLNGNLQFSSRDEYRYHEALVHPAMAVARERSEPAKAAGGAVAPASRGGPRPPRDPSEPAKAAGGAVAPASRGGPRPPRNPIQVVIGGGGDGLAAREILKWPDVERITVVDLDRAVTDLARDYQPLAALNGGAFRDPRVHVENQDAMRWFRETDVTADVVVLDFPDPGTYAVGKLYSTAFYASVRRHLSPDGALVVQSSSPFLAPRTFECIDRTLRAVGLHTRPYHAFVPSFGVWGFVLASARPFDAPATLPPGLPLRFLHDDALRSLFEPAPDSVARGAAPVVRVNRLDNQALVSYYLDEWGRWEGR